MEKYVRKMGNNWFWVHKIVLEKWGKHIGPYGIAVYCALAFYENQKTSSCFPKVDTICELIGAGRTKVSSSLKKLVKFGLVKKIRRHDSSNIYYLLQVNTTKYEKSRKSDEDEMRDAIKGDNPEITSMCADLVDYLKIKIKVNKPDFIFNSEFDSRNTEDVYEMLTKDNRNYDRIKRVIDYAHRSHFWKSIIHSMDDVRKHFDKLEMQVDGEKEKVTRRKKPGVTGIKSGLNRKRVRREQKKRLMEINQKKSAAERTKEIERRLEEDRKNWAKEEKERENSGEDNEEQY